MRLENNEFENRRVRRDLRSAIETDVANMASNIIQQTYSTTKIQTKLRGYEVDAFGNPTDRILGVFER